MPNDYEAHSPIPSPSEVANRFGNEVLNNRNLAVIDEIAAEDYVELDLPPGQAPGREGVCVMFVRRASALAMCVTFLGGFLAFFLLPADPALAQDPATTCLQGYVWRVARPADLVCVTPQSRRTVAAENELTSFRREPGPRDGVFFCLSGFVWREAFDGDTVCVPSHARDRVTAENAQARSRTVAGGTEWNAEGSHVLEIGVAAARDASEDRNFSGCGRLNPLMRGMVGWGQAEHGEHSVACMSFVLERAVQFDRTLIGQLSPGKMRIDRVVLSYEENEPLTYGVDMCGLVVGEKEAGRAADRCWQSGNGKYEFKQDGCVVVRVPSVDWERNGGAFPGRLPVFADRQQPIARIDSRHWDVTAPIRWQLGANPDLGGSVGFGLLLTGWPMSTDQLTAQDRTVCASQIVNVALTITYTVLPKGKVSEPR